MSIKSENPQEMNAEECMTDNCPSSKLSPIDYNGTEIAISGIKFNTADIVRVINLVMTIVTFSTPPIAREKAERTKCDIYINPEWDPRDASCETYQGVDISYNRLLRVFLNLDFYRQLITGTDKVDKKTTSTVSIHQKQQKLAELKKTLITVTRVCEKNPNAQDLQKRVSSIKKEIETLDAELTTPKTSMPKKETVAEVGSIEYYMNTVANAKKFKLLLAAALYPCYKPFLFDDNGKFKMNLCEVICLTYEARHNKKKWNERMIKQQEMEEKQNELIAIYKRLTNAGSADDNWRSKKEDTGDLCEKFTRWACAKSNQCTIRAREEELFNKWYSLQIHCLNLRTIPGSQEVSKMFNKACYEWNKKNAPAPVIKPTDGISLRPCNTYKKVKSTVPETIKAAVSIVPEVVEEETEEAPKPDLHTLILPIGHCNNFVRRAWLNQHDGEYDDIATWSIEEQIGAREEIDTAAQTWYNTKRIHRRPFLCQPPPVFIYSS